MSFWRKISPSRAVRDFAHEFMRPTPYRWPIIGASALATFTIFSVMWQEEAVGPPPRPEITYITTFAPGRSDKEIAASNLANQKVQDKLAAEQAERDERVKGIYRTLGRISGMDVDKIERDAEAERAAEARAEAQQQAELRGRSVATE
ncbi:hypothetical protein MB02_16870 [Croceicoccus estronivorus]|uniref:hypothetical protein n=1 Tax=Croceicoccus estronivorus TaxID=1172626 RepID=UPI00082C0A03|nr:hypothetical protein [Croceicoccus estronivorus]OCC22435.1 hypothetical protein MB02_16870 [Croceicoccus estronivorus]